LLHKTSSGEPAALISNVQRYTVHDGPGIRTAIFFIGCTMRCIWCSNPETLKPYQQLCIYPVRCISKEKCGHCIKSCPIEKSPISFDEKGFLTKLKIEDRCDGCLICSQACPSGAIGSWGDLKTLPQLMEIIKADNAFYSRSGGGVTLNGGEVMMQWEIASKLLLSCKNAGINTCVETALHCPAEHMEAVYEYTDLVIADIKCLDPKKHEKFTGVRNDLILSNLIKTVGMGKKLIIRTPVIPGYNDDEREIRAIAEFIKNELYGEIKSWQLLPFRKLGAEKYESLMLEYPMKDYVSQDRTTWEASLAHLVNMIKTDYHLPAEPLV